VDTAMVVMVRCCLNFCLKTDQRNLNLAFFRAQNAFMKTCFGYFELILFVLQEVMVVRTEDIDQVITVINFILQIKITKILE
jgi:hypothetical protein